MHVITIQKRKKIITKQYILYKKGKYLTNFLKDLFD